MPNPFHPAPGALPTQISGREGELAAIREAVRRARAREAPTPLVIVGQRGMGKTVLLRSLRDLAGSHALAIPIETLPKHSLASRLREKLDDTLASVEPLPERAAAALRKALELLPKFSYELPNDGGAIALGAPSELEPHPDIDRRSLVAMLAALHRAARAAKRFLVLTIDEVQDADFDSIETIATLVHESAQGESPILLAVAGLSETRDLIDKLRTYAQRWDLFDLRFLTLAETIESIREPIVQQGASIDEDALYLLATESGGYPYFIQAYASAAWDAHRGKTISLDDVEKSLIDVKRRNEMSFYIRPLSKLTARETLFALTLARLGPGVHAIGDVARALGTTAPAISSLRASLVKKHIVSSPIPGQIEFRIPYTDRFILKHEEDYDNLDVRAARLAFERKSAQKES